MGIVIFALGRVERGVLEVLKEDLERVFAREVTIGEAMDEPKYTLNERRGQYQSEAILSDIMNSRKYDGFERILGVVDLDLYAPGLNFVFGVAGAKAALISLSRLREGGEKALLSRRTLTEAVHELGHTYGLGHCRSSGCVMFFSNTLLDTDRKGPGFCDKCEKRLKKMDIL